LTIDNDADKCILELMIRPDCENSFSGKKKFANWRGN